MPRSARRSAVARPMPVEQPVMRTGPGSMGEDSSAAARRSSRPRARTSSVWAPLPMRPRSSHSSVSASPTPSTRVTASTPTHSPSGGRSRWTVSSVLMNRYSRQSSTALTPLPTSATTIRRSSGARLLALHERAPHAHPDERRAGLEEAAVHEPVLHRRVVAGLLTGGKEVAVAALVGAGRRRIRTRAARRPRPRARRWRASPRRPGRPGSPPAARRCGPGARPAPRRSAAPAARARGSRP